MTDSFVSTFRAAGFLPHGYCFLWNPELLGIHIFSDLVVGVAYYAIPAALIYFLGKRSQSLPFQWIVGLYAMFILLCGTTHFFSIYTLWRPSYWVEGLLKVITALVSLVTAAVTIRLLPKLLDLLAPEKLEQQRLSKQRLELLQEFSSEGVLKLDSVGQCTFQNPAWSELTGLSQEETTQDDGWHQGIYEADQPYFIQMFNEALFQEQLFEADVRLNSLSPQWVHMTAWPEFDENGLFSGFWALVRPIDSPGREAEERL